MQRHLVIPGVPISKSLDFETTFRGPWWNRLTPVCPKSSLNHLTFQFLVSFPVFLAILPGLQPPCQCNPIRQTPHLLLFLKITHETQHLYGTDQFEVVWILSQFMVYVHYLVNVIYYRLYIYDWETVAALFHFRLTLFDQTGLFVRDCYKIKFALLCSFDASCSAICGNFLLHRVIRI